ncbi:MAG: hypothetical protein F6K19_39955 [Cyanothece sp. SIO1E1]|nr:hypothetical protein [Cyanothece sp. SIO1E1]
MTQVLAQNQVAQLKQCLSLARDVSSSQSVNQTFEVLKNNVAIAHPEAAEMMQLLWQEVLSARRSATFWQEVCNIEKQLSEQITENHQQLKQNHMRLMQKQ